MEFFLSHKHFILIGAIVVCLPTSVCSETIEESLPAFTQSTATASLTLESAINAMLENDPQIQSNVELHKELNEHKKNEAVHAVCEGLTQTQVEKMKQLAESVEFTTDEEFADKLVTLRTSYFTEAVKTADSSALNEEVQIEEDKPEVKTTASADPLINAAASAISKSVVK